MKNIKKLSEEILAGRVLDKALQSFGRPAPCNVGEIWDEDKKKCVNIDEMTKGAKMETVAQKKKEKIEDRPDYMHYEDDYDIVDVRPVEWEVVITDKETDEEFDGGSFETREEAQEAFDKEIKELEKDRDKAEDEAKNEEEE